MVVDGQPSGYYNIYRSLLIFDTSAVSGRVTAGYIALLPKSKHGFTDADKLVVTNGQPTCPHDPFVLTDYNMNNYSGNGGEIAGSEITEFEWANIMLNEIGLSWINVGGTTKLCIRSQNDIDGIEPLLWDCPYITAYTPPRLYLTTSPVTRSFGTIIG